jgi:hypothetical protein
MVFFFLFMVLLGVVDGALGVGVGLRCGGARGVGFGFGGGGGRFFHTLSRHV